MKLNFLIGAIMAALLTMIASPRAVAGPDPITARSYIRVNTMAEAQAIKPGARIAIRCGHCGAVFMMNADKEQSYLHGWVCPICRAKFVVKQDPHGGQRVEYSLEDDAGERSDLLKATD